MKLVLGEFPCLNYKVYKYLWHPSLVRSPYFYYLVSNVDIGDRSIKVRYVPSYHNESVANNNYTQISGVFEAGVSANQQSSPQHQHVGKQELESVPKEFEKFLGFAAVLHFGASDEYPKGDHTNRAGSSWESAMKKEKKKLENRKTISAMFSLPACFYK